MGRKPAGQVLVYQGRRYTWSVKGYWRCTTMGNRHNLTRLIWEQHNGTIPAGHKIIYLDGNRNNLTLKNLACLSHSECQKRRLQDPEYRLMDKCFLMYGHLIKKIADIAEPGRSRKRALKAWVTRRIRYGQSGGNQ
jgi:hypothetical protein